MPHIIVKMVSGRSERQKIALAEAITQVVMAGAHVTEDAVSVSIEDVDASEWTERVYEPDIVDKAGTLYKKPGYGPG